MGNMLEAPGEHMETSLREGLQLGANLLIQQQPGPHPPERSGRSPTSSPLSQGMPAGLYHQADLARRPLTPKALPG